jgi:hypothetical protein
VVFFTFTLLISQNIIRQNLESFLRGLGGAIYSCFLELPLTAFWYRFRARRAHFELFFVLTKERRIPNRSACCYPLEKLDCKKQFYSQRRGFLKCRLCLLEITVVEGQLSILERHNRPNVTSIVAQKIRKVAKQGRVSTFRRLRMGIVSPTIRLRPLSKCRTSLITFGPLGSNPPFSRVIKIYDANVPSFPHLQLL